MIQIDQLVRELRPNRTVLFFGAGSSMPSGVPSGDQLKQTLAEKFEINGADFSLSDLSQLAEIKAGRPSLIAALRAAIGRPSPTGSLLNLPLYRWKSIFTTNYDELIESSYRRRSKSLIYYNTDFDFSKPTTPDDALLFKLHGTITQDVADGSKSRIILTTADYDKTSEYRESVYDRFSSDLAGADLVVIGQKLNDPDIKAIVDRALMVQARTYGASGTVTLLLFERDEDRAALFESRGIRVCFGGLDEIFAGLAAIAAKDVPDLTPTSDPLDQRLALRPATIDVIHANAAFAASVSAMFNGKPASYADIKAGLTFDRSVANNIVKCLLERDKICATLIGASGVGKTTAARQVALKLTTEGWFAWEHKTDFRLIAKEWIDVARVIAKLGRRAVLIVDEAHGHLQATNELLDALSASNLENLKIVLISTRSNWIPRLKSPAVFKRGREFSLSTLNTLEIDRLITLVESSDQIRPLVEHSFSGFSRVQKRSRLIDRCEQDMFVCLKNIFASEKFDDIILREYNDLADDLQHVYRVVSAMESSGVRVHRQLVIRALRLPPDSVSGILDRLADIITEYDISVQQGLYGWRVRHQIIAEIITRYKFFHIEEFINLFDLVIDNLSPSYEIERRTINEICNFDTGLARISDKRTQNRLLRRLISIAPGERVPRHRLIRNLIDIDEYDLAETEIRVFESEIGKDGPVARYRASLLLGRALHTPGLSTADRAVILLNARSSAQSSQQRFPGNRSLFGVACDIGLEIWRLTNERESFDEALMALKRAESRLADPEVTKMIRRYERLMMNQSANPLAVIISTKIQENIVEEQANY